MVGSPELTHSVDEIQNSKHALMSQSNNQISKKSGQQIVHKSSSQSLFPMQPEDLVKNYGKMLSSYERDEVLDFKEPIFYINFNSNYKGHGKYHKNEINYLDENPEKNITATGILNNGFSNEQADYFFEAKD